MRKSIQNYASDEIQSIESLKPDIQLCLFNVRFDYTIVTKTYIEIRVVSLTSRLSNIG